MPVGERECDVLAFRPPDPMRLWRRVRLSRMRATPRRRRLDQRTVHQPEYVQCLSRLFGQQHGCTNADAADYAFCWVSAVDEVGFV